LVMFSDLVFLTLLSLGCSSLVVSTIESN